MDTIKIMLGKAVRYFIVLIIGSYLQRLVESGLLTQGTVDQWIECTVAILVALGLLCWTIFIRPWIKKWLAKTK